MGQGAGENLCFCRGEAVSQFLIPSLILGSWWCWTAAGQGLRGVPTPAGTGAGRAGRLGSSRRSSGPGEVLLLTLFLLQVNDSLPALTVGQSIFTRLVWTADNRWIRNCQMGIN